MKRNNKYLFGVAFFFLMGVLVSSCKPDPEPIPDPDSIINSQEGRIAYLLNEGLWGNNDAEISRLNITKGNVLNEFFLAQNGRGLGDLAQDIKQYGSKIYVVVWNSNTIEVLNSVTGKSIKQIPLSGKGPRYVAFDEGKAYVSCYDKTIVRIDTMSLEIESTCTLSGMQPEDLVVKNGKLYVASGWEYAENGKAIYDNKINVVDLASFSMESTLTCGTNPYKVMVYDDKIVVGYWGDYGTEPSGIEFLDPETGNRTLLVQDASGFDIYQGILYYYAFSYSTNKSEYWKLNLASREKTALSLSGSEKIVTPYGIVVDPFTGDVYITDSQQYRGNGDVYCFSTSGTLKWKVETGIGPSKICFVK